MPIYYGSSADGSDIKEFEGMHVSPDGKSWSSHAFAKTKEQRMYDRILEHINGKRSLRDEYNLIQQKISKLSRMERDYLVSLFADEQQT